MVENVLVTGASGAAAVAVARSLEGLEWRVFLADLDPFAAGLYLAPAARRIALPPATAPGYAEAVLGACRRHAIGLLVPTTDAELLPLARHRALLAAAGVQLVAAPVAGIEICLDRLRLTEVLAGYVPMPRTVLLDERFLPGDLPFPLVARPRRATGGRGLVEIEDAAALARIKRRGDVIAQELLPGRETTVDVLASRRGRALIAVAREQLRGESGIAVVARTIRDPELETLAARIVERLGLAFASTVHFRRDEKGCARLVEVTPRFSTTTSSTVAAGVDMPRLALCAALGRPVSTRGLEVHEVALVRCWEERFLPCDELGRVAGRAPGELVA